MCGRIRFCIYSNWTTFYRDLVLPGCVQRLHVPCLDFKRLPIAGRVADVCVAFRPRQGQVALYMVGPPGIKAKMHGDEWRGLVGAAVDYGPDPESSTK